MRTVLISGAGVAGLSLAHWLRRHGFQPTLVERAPALRTGGQAIDIRGAARDVVQRMGIIDAVRAKHTGTHGIAWLNPSGQRVASMKNDTYGHSGGVIAEIEILRGDLVRILHEAAGLDVEIVYDNMITAMTERPDGVEVTFATGPSRTFDLVVGADGVRSGVRTLTFNRENEIVRDLGYYMSYFPASSTVDLDGWMQMYNLPAGNGVDGRVALLYPLGTTGALRAMLAFVSPELAYDHRDIQAQKQILANVFAHAGWQIPNLVEQLWQADDLYFERVVEIRIDQWYRGRTALLGDAAFAGSAGMGTSMALVGAYVLAGELAAADGDHRVAFARYDEHMRPYVTRNLKRPPGGTRGFAPRTRHGIWLRNKLTALMLHLPGADKAMRDMEKATNAITLPPYPNLLDEPSEPAGRGDVGSS